MVSAREAFVALREELAKAEIEQAGHEAGLLFAHVCGVTRFERDKVTPAEQKRMQELAEKRIHHYPLQYLLESWPFLDLELAVGPGVLIPRPETEEVCLAAAELISSLEQPEVLDLCAGTGAIALGLQHQFPRGNFFAVEWDREALSYLKKNVRTFAETYGRTPRVIREDVLYYHENLDNCRYDMIVSNPPYVTEAEYQTLAPELRYEPKQALVAEEEGLQFYRVITRDYYPALKPGGPLVFEIGTGQGESVRSLLVDGGYEGVEIRRDTAGNDRIAIGRKP